MAHIAEYMIDPSLRPPPRNISSRTPSPQTSQETINEKSAVEDEEKGKFVWRMHQPTESRKYQLFPVQETITPGLRRRSPDQESQTVPQPTRLDRFLSMGHIKLKREQFLSRRRKPNVSDLGPMTTVQEVAMDSPTIPGRPPLHERSISAPGHCMLRRNVLGDSLMSMVSGPAIDETSEVTTAPIHQRRRSDSPKSPRSPKNLAPLIIPVNIASLSRRPVAKSSSDGKLREDGAPEVPPKSARMFKSDRPSPQTTQTTPQTPVTSSTLLLASASATPISAFSGRSSPFSAVSSVNGPSPGEHLRTFSASGSTSDIYAKYSHKRNDSENSIMDRGRPKKRQDGSPVKTTKNSITTDQRAFETLPQGVKACEAFTVYPRQDIEALKNQAIGQAARFEVLCPGDVDNLSRELRGLDERCEYLRKTHQSLRSGRRSLHQRICTYLRSPRIARFSHESLLRQEEALSELDTSIDDWVSKLEQAENRRTRVRQKLLEHVAAALTLDVSKSKAGGTGEQTPPRSPTKSCGATSTSSEREVGRDSPSPHRLARTVPPTAMIVPPPVYRNPSASPNPAAVAAPTIPTTSPPSTAQSVNLPPSLVIPPAHLPATVFQPLSVAPAAPTSTSPHPPPPPSSSTSASTSTTTVTPPATLQPTTKQSTTHLPPPCSLMRQLSTSSVHTSGRPSGESIRIYADSDMYALLADVEEEINRMGHVEEEEPVKAAAPIAPGTGVKKDAVQGGETLGRTVFGGVVPTDSGGLGIST